MLDQGFIGETEAHLRVSSRWETAAGSSIVATWGDDLKCDVKTLCVL
jgi:hypothetical protein